MNNEDTIKYLVGILIVVCVLLLFCNFKVSVSKQNLGPDGIRFRQGYATGPRFGRFRENYVVAFPDDTRLVYNSRKTEGLENDDAPVASMHGLETTNYVNHLSSSQSCREKKGGNVDLMWISSADIPLDVYTRDGHITNHAFSPAEEEQMINTFFSRNSNQVKQAGTGSLGGSILKYSDYGVAHGSSREVTV